MGKGYEIKARIQGGFWQHFQSLVRDRVIPYQWRAMNDQIPGAPKSHSVENFRLAAQRSSDGYEGMVFQDSDLYKWLEAAGNVEKDGSPVSESIQGWVEEAVDLIAASQLPDGYVNTYFVTNGADGRWKNLRDAHELYCAGHLIEAAVSLARSGRTTKLLDVARRFADLIDRTFGVEEGKIRGYPGHEEIELALMKLYDYTGERRYLDRARYFVDERGSSPSYFETEAKAPGFAQVFAGRKLEYYQAHLPVREQTETVGHAVRAMYLFIALADLALETGEEELVQSCDRLWESTTARKMYVTGSIGSSWVFESFGADYDLPNDTAYAETCAAIGLFLFSSRLLRLHNDRRYADVMERCLYNGILSGLAKDGESYFYVNPLEVRPEVCDSNPSYRTVKYRRQPWYGVACCPPNIARTLTGLDQHLYHVNGDILYVDLYHEGTASISIEGSSITLHQRTAYPWEGEVLLELALEKPQEFAIALRLPEWCRGGRLEVNGERLEKEAEGDGYLHVAREWKQGDRIALTLAMGVERVYAAPQVSADVGRVAVQRGPIVYCLEEVDNGPQLHQLRLPADAELEAVWKEELLGGVVAVVAKGRGPDRTARGDAGLYHSAAPRGDVRRDLLLVPYFTWANRSSGEMMVWLRE